MMRVLHTKGDWALILREDDNTFLVRHLTCKAYMRMYANKGCVCKALDAAIGKRKIEPVDPEIFTMYKFLTEK